MKTLLFLFSFLLALPLSAQFRMIGNVSGSWTHLGGEQYLGTVNFQSDLTGEGHLATSITKGMKLFTPLQSIHPIDSVHAQDFSSATLQIRATGGTPNGQIMVYDPVGIIGVPQIPVGSIGATNQMQAAIVTHNNKVFSDSLLAIIARLNQSAQPVFDSTITVSDDLLPGTVTQITRTAAELGFDTLDGISGAPLTGEAFGDPADSNSDLVIVKVIDVTSDQLTIYLLNVGALTLTSDFGIGIKLWEP